MFFDNILFYRSSIKTFIILSVDELLVIKS